MNIPEETNRLRDSLSEKGAESYITFSVPEMPFINPGDNIGEIINERMARVGGFQDHDVLVIASKAVSFAEDCIVDLSTITPSPTAYEISEQLGGRKSPELVELILSESQPGAYDVKPEYKVIICWHKLGFYVTSAAVDKLDSENKSAIILPENPDASAIGIMREIHERSGKNVAVILSDSEGRPDREGAGAIAIGCAGIDPLRIEVDGQGKTSMETQVDFLVNAASVLLGQRDRGVPAVVIRGHAFEHNPNANMAKAIHRAKK